MAAVWIAWPSTNLQDCFLSLDTEDQTNHPSAEEERQLCVFITLNHKTQGIHLPTCAKEHCCSSINFQKHTQPNLMLLHDPAKVISHENDPEIVILYHHNQAELFYEIFLFILLLHCRFYIYMTLFTLLICIWFFIFLYIHILIQTFIWNGTITCFILCPSPFRLGPLFWFCTLPDKDTSRVLHEDLEWTLQLTPCVQTYLTF